MDLLARFDADLPTRPLNARAPAPTAPAAHRSNSTVQVPNASPTPDAVPAQVVEGPQAPQQPFPDVAPTRAPSSHVYVVTVLLDGVEQQYGVLAVSIGAAIAIAVRATETGVVVAARRGLPALS